MEKRIFLLFLYLNFTLADVEKFLVKVFKFCFSCFVDFRESIEKAEHASM